jgi:hypothetical protein
MNGAENGATAGEDAEAPEPPPLASYTARRDANGRLVEFPFLRNGVFQQVALRYGRDENGEQVVTAMTLTFSPGETIEITVLTMDEGRPVTARIKAGDAFYFASFLWQAGDCVEMWTDEAGVPLEVLHDERIFHYDGMKNVTFIGYGGLSGEGTDGVREVSAYYNEKGPRYWTRDGMTFAFRRDETGLLTGLADITDGADTREDGDGPPAVNSTYAYAFDRNGNWTERRETRWSRLNEYLVPSEGAVITRLIEY